MKFLYEGTLANILNRLIDLILLNLLWFLCCIPIFTIGASTCALYEITLHYAFGDDPPVVRTFFGAFKKHFKKAGLLFLIAAAAGGFLLLDLWCAFQWEIGIRFLFIVIILAVFYFYLAVFSHAFPALTYFQSGIKETLVTAFVLSMRNGIFTVFIMVLNLLPGFLILLFPMYFGQILFFYFILGASVIAYLCSLHLARLFDPERAKAAMEESETSERKSR